jgi:hypothetical protein
MNRNRLSLYFPSRLHNALVFREASASQHACLPRTNEYAPCSRILFQQAQLPPLNRNLCPIRGVRQNRSLFAAEGTETVLKSELKKSYVVYVSSVNG